MLEAENNFYTAYAQFAASFGTDCGNYLMNGYGILWRLLKKTHKYANSSNTSNLKANNAKLSSRVLRLTFHVCCVQIASHLVLTVFKNA